MNLQFIHGKELLANDRIPVITPVRNEIHLLPHFLKHYRKIADTQLIIIDNGSTDGTTDYLRAQEDIVLIYTQDSYKDSNFGIDWVNRLLRENYIGRWACHADCDEFLIFPHMENRSLTSFLESCTAAGANTVYGPMLDMYPKGDFMALTVRDDDEAFAEIKWLDGDYMFRPWPRRPWDPKREPGFPVEVLGGPLWRLLGHSLERPAGSLHRTIFNIMTRLRTLVPPTFLPTFARLMPSETPARHKVPLNFISNDFRYFNAHTSTNRRFAPENVAFLHMKFCSNLARRLELATQEQQHFLGGIPELQMAHALGKLKNNSLHYDGSREFIDSSTLLAHGLIGNRISPVWRDTQFKTAVRLH